MKIQIKIPVDENSEESPCNEYTEKSSCDSDSTASREHGIYKPVKSVHSIKKNCH